MQTTSADSGTTSSRESEKGKSRQFSRRVSGVRGFASGRPSAQGGLIPPEQDKREGSRGARPVGQTGGTMQTTSTDSGTTSSRTVAASTSSHAYPWPACPCYEGQEAGEWTDSGACFAPLGPRCFISCTGSPGTAAKKDRGQRRLSRLCPPFVEIHSL